MKICVIGSINLDMIIESDRFVSKSETILGNNYRESFGGKGANQAVSAAKLGANVSFIGGIGNDSIGDKFLNNFKFYGIDTTGIEIYKDVHSGIAAITVAENTNSIIVVSGANAKVDEKIIDKNKNIILSSDIVIMQLEIPMKTVEYVVDLCYENDVKVVLNPAPAEVLSQNLIDKCTFIIPNETEVLKIFDDKFVDFKDAMEFYKEKLIVTYGKKGVYFYDKLEGIKHIKANEVKVVDTTGAGDCFVGAFCVRYIETNNVEESIKFANVSSGLKVQGIGAQSSIPDRETVDKYIKSLK